MRQQPLGSACYRLNRFIHFLVHGGAMLRKRLTAFVSVYLLLPLLLPGHLSATPGQRGDDPESRRWYVYHEATYSGNHGLWTNFMTIKDHDPGEVVSLSMVDKTDPYTKPMCIQMTITFKYAWAGVAVASAPDYWGKEDLPGFDLSKAEKLVFYAKGKEGGEAITVKMAIAGKEPHGDSAKFAPTSELIVLTDKWTRHEISLKGVDLKRVITPFVVTAEKVYNQASAITFYLDEIYFVFKEDIPKISSAPAQEKYPFFAYLQDDRAGLVAFSPTSHDPRPA
jgi:hypothetical protein